MTRKKRRKQAPSATPWDGLDADMLTPAQELVRETHRSAYAFRHESFVGDIAFFNQFARDFCPWCGSSRISKRAYDKKGMRRWQCGNCGKAFTPATGTVFDSRKLPLSAWVDFLLQVFSFESMAAITREDRRSDTTTPYWLGKVFAVLSDIQDGIVLSGRVQIDETYYPVPGKEAIEVDGKKLRGLSRNKICIGIGCDDSGRSYYVREGLGKTSSAKTVAAFGEHIERGSLLIHDMEKGHRSLVRKLGLSQESYNSKLLSKLDDEDNPLGNVNRLCYLVKRFLDSHSGFDRDDLSGYLDVFSVMMNPPENKMEKVVSVLNRAMSNPNTLRFRDFYNLKPSSDG
jgi:transposase-like protein